MARQYSGTLGKTGNCQIGVSVQMVTDQASVAANWRLFCPASWDDNKIDDPEVAAQVRARRARAGIPDEVRHREKWRLALDMLDQMLTPEASEPAGGWGLPKRPVVGDSGYGDPTRVPAGTHRTRAGLRPAGRSHRHRPPRRSGTRHCAVHWPRPPAQASLPRRTSPPAGTGSVRRTCRLPPGHLAQRHQENQGQPDRGDALALPGVRVRPANRHIPRAADGSLPVDQMRQILIHQPEPRRGRTDQRPTVIPFLKPKTGLVTHTEQTYQHRPHPPGTPRTSPNATISRLRGGHRSWRH